MRMTMCRSVICIKMLKVTVTSGLYTTSLSAYSRAEWTNIHRFSCASRFFLSSSSCDSPLLFIFIKFSKSFRFTLMIRFFCLKLIRGRHRHLSFFFSLSLSLCSQHFWVFFMSLNSLFQFSSSRVFSSTIPSSLSSLHFCKKSWSGIKDRKRSKRRDVEVTGKKGEWGWKSLRAVLSGNVR